ncbi:T9SS type A sorting domain-containing protein [Spirosoma taeanense]|uniref:T9SS type A sorting domain-containing protein n=1 Tax=Spirosoma taeanense TaxID=2735870 RepID=A0A6M5YAX9_9BACT|nr:FG-GAP-like repeat-containing protein [Spirosoma taeanense]QJW91129.1 T9SS type A sorting domain-containing protein [Spirosoma taeanense]
MKKAFTLVCCLFASAGFAQSTTRLFSFQYDQRPTVSLNGRTLLNPWAGGLNATLYATLRLNDDAREDLLVFDRTTRKASTFVAIDNPTGSGIAWQYAPEYETALPPIEDWMILVDYDGDGKKDVFTLGASNVRVYRNESQNGRPAFRLVANPLMTEGFSGAQPLYASSTDLPAITDFDDDGDVDVLSFDPTGNLIAFQQNMSVERTGKKDGLDFKRMSCEFWGHFRKEYCNDFTFGIPCNGVVGMAQPGAMKALPAQTSTKGARPMHTGNTLTVLDADGDGRKDLLFGFVSCQNIARLRNTGTNDANANFTSFDSLFPAQNPIRFPAYAAAYWEDVDGDGQKDLLASPYVDFNDNQTFDFRASGWFYRNAGTSQKPDFRLVQKDFLQSEMLDLGENAAPALADLDGDGDADLLVGYSGLRNGSQYRGGIWQFENKGTVQNPAFVLVTTDYLGLSQSLTLTDVLPAFADVDANGSLDLVVTGTGARSVEMRALLNVAPKGAAVRYDLATAVRWPTPDLMIPGDRPTLADVDRDGRVDLLIGKSSDGTIHYFRNTGTAASPVFQLQNQAFGGFTTDNSFRIRARSLVVADLNGDRKDELVAAGNNGSVRIYQFPDRPDQSLTLLDSLPVLGLPGMGLIAAAADLDGDQSPDLMLGSRGGGIRYLRNTSPKVVITGLPEEPTGPWAFPNPTDRFLTVRSPHDGRLELLSLSGQTMLPVQTVRSGDETILDVSSLPDGTYLLRLSADSRPAQVQKVVVWK